MDYKIVADSSCDLNDELSEKLNLGLVPLKIDVEDKSFIDDENLDTKDLIKAMRESNKGVKTACPSTMDFIKEYEEGENIFGVTLSSKLSGTYNNAVLAKDMYLEENNKFIHIFDSKSASVGETLIAIKIDELAKKDIEPEDLVKEVDSYIEEMNTFFILEDLDNLIKNGRMSKLVGGIASALNIKPIMGAKNGAIELVDKVRGTKRAFSRLVEIIGENGKDLNNKILGIAHCNAEDKAIELKKDIEEVYSFKEVIVVETQGLSTAYANDGGIIIAY